MVIRIVEIGEPATRNLRKNSWQSTFDVDFESEAVSGKATLTILHSSPNVSMKLLRDEYLLRELVVDSSVESVTDFEKESVPGRQKITPLGPRGEFTFEGYIAQHLISGDGSVFKSNGLELILNRNLILADFDGLEIEDWVKFIAKGFGFWIW